jgi:hypothetical protein
MFQVRHVGSSAVERLSYSNVAYGKQRKQRTILRFELQTRQNPEEAPDRMHAHISKA